MYEMDFEGKVAIVTGGSQGIGKSYCSALLSKGMKVCVCDINEEAALAFIETLSNVQKENIIFQKCDVTSYTNFKGAFDKVISIFGRVDLVVNNAGILNEHEWEKVVAVNFIGVIHGIKLAFEFMDIKKNGCGGIVVNTASNAGFEAFALGPVYAGCKHGVVGLTKSYGTDFHFKRTGVKVCAVCPGPVDTAIFHEFPAMSLDEEMAKRLIDPMNPIKPEVVANALLQILKDGQNGSLLRVDGTDGCRYVE